jgi:hypothetical protein
MTAERHRQKWIPVLRPMALSTINAPHDLFSPNRFTRLADHAQTAGVCYGQDK